MTQFLMESGHSLGTQTSFFSRLTDSLPQPGDYFDTKILMLLLLFLELSVGSPSLSGQVHNRQGPSESPLSLVSYQSLRSLPWYLVPAASMFSLNSKHLTCFSLLLAQLAGSSASILDVISSWRILRAPTIGS